jgi:hypothetical protein
MCVVCLKGNYETQHLVIKRQTVSLILEVYRKRFLYVNLLNALSCVCHFHERTHPCVRENDLRFHYCITGSLFGYILCRQNTRATRLFLTVGFTHFMFYSLFMYCKFHISLLILPHSKEIRQYKAYALIQC